MINGSEIEEEEEDEQVSVNDQTFDEGDPSQPGEIIPESYNSLNSEHVRSLKVQSKMDAYCEALLRKKTNEQLDY